MDDLPTCSKCGYTRQLGEFGSRDKCTRCGKTYEWAKNKTPLSREDTEKIKSSIQAAAKAKFETESKSAAKAATEPKSALNEEPIQHPSAPPQEGEAAVKKNEQLALSEAIKRGDWSSVPVHVVVQLANGITITTGPDIPQRKITEIVDVILAECDFGIDALNDFFKGGSDSQGGRSASSQKIFHNARKIALYELRKEALLIGADAVIGVNLNLSEISGGKKALIVVSANGTAVKLEPK